MDQEIDYDKVDFLKSCAPSKTKRFLGNLIDGILVTMISGVFIAPVMVIAPENPILQFYCESNWFISQLLSTVFYLIYYIPFEYYRQSSLGKLIFKMKVVNEYDGGKPTLNSIIQRTLIRILGFEALVYLFGGNLWHDRWSDTLVIDLEKYEARIELESLGEGADVSL